MTLCNQKNPSSNPTPNFDKLFFLLWFLPPPSPGCLFLFFSNKQIITGAGGTIAQCVVVVVVFCPGGGDVMPNSSPLRDPSERIQSRLIPQFRVWICHEKGAPKFNHCNCFSTFGEWKKSESLISFKGVLIFAAIKWFPMGWDDGLKQVLAIATMGCGEKKMVIVSGQLTCS